jgi:hypothetical protein
MTSNLPTESPMSLGASVFGLVMRLLIAPGSDRFNTDSETHQSFVLLS